MNLQQRHGLYLVAVLIRDHGQDPLLPASALDAVIPIRRDRNDGSLHHQQCKHCVAEVWSCGRKVSDPNSRPADEVEASVK